MLNGLVGAQQMYVPAGGGGGGGGVYPTALIELDFIAGNYFVGGFAVALADIFNESCSVDASGLSCAAGRKTFKGDAYTAALTTYFTVVAEWSYVLATSGYCVPFFVYDASSYGIDMYSNRGGVGMEQYNASASFNLDWSGPFADTGYDILSPARCAATRTSGRWAITAQGYSPANASTGSDVSFTPTAAGIGDATGGKAAGMKMRKFALLPPQLDADLPALSTL